MIVGETHTPVAIFLDADNAAYGPTTVTVTVRSPQGILTHPAVTNPSLGHYETTFTVNRIGIWRYEFEGIGPEGVVVREIGSACVEADVAA